MRSGPLQNRVAPSGEIIATAARGTRMGNRGVLHNGRALGTPRWRHKNWVCCVLSFKGRRRELIAPNRYTELFFLDEAVAFAAGHRPCAECQRDRYNAYRAAWEVALGPVERARDIDAALHSARVTRNRQHIRHEAKAADLPDGVFVQIGKRAYLLRGDSALPFGFQGYGAKHKRPMGVVTVLTPAPTVRALREGYAPQLHETA